MTGSARVRPGPLLAVAVLLWGAVAACSDFFVDPERGSSDLEMVFGMASGGGGSAEAFAKTQAVHVTVRDAQTEAVVFDATLPAGATGGEIRVPVAVDGVEDGLAVFISVALLFEGQPIFAGSGTGVLRLGLSEPVEIVLAPVANGVVFPAEQLVIEELQVPVPLEAAVVFATGDSIPGAPIAWTSANPDLVEIVNQSQAVAYANGTTSITAASMGASGVLAVLVQAPIPPGVTTGAASAVGPASADLNGSVNPNGFPTQGWFEWGTDPGLVGAASTPAQSLGSGTADQSLTATLTDLGSGVQYYFRAVASNSAGETRGSILSFRTAAPPAVTTGSATQVTGSSAVLNGSVNPGGAATQAWFEWGTDRTMASFTTTPQQGVGSGTTTQTFSASLGNLQEGVQYFFRAAASNTAGTSRGTVASFTPVSPPAAPSGAVAVWDLDYQWVRVTWVDNSNNETSFQIHRSDNVVGNYFLRATVGANVRVFDDTAVNFDVKYYYKVRACNAAGCSAFTPDTSAYYPIGAASSSSEALDRIRLPRPR